MLEKLQQISFDPLRFGIKFVRQNLVDLLNTPLSIDKFPNPGGNRVLQTIEPSDLRPGLLDRYKQNYPIDHSPGKQRIFFKALVDEVFQLSNLFFLAVRTSGRIA